MTEEEARTCCLVLFSNYPSARPSLLTIQSFTAAFEAMSHDVAMAAIDRLSATSKFPPSKAELIEACATNVLGKRRSGEDAYAELMTMVRRHGRCYGDDPSPEFEDPLIKRCLGVWGSWNTLCDSPPDDPAGRMRFIQMYNQKALEVETNALLPQLQGDRRLRHRLAERANTERRDIGELTDKVKAVPEARRLPSAGDSQHRGAVRTR